MTYDVIATEIATGKVRTIATGKDERNAKAIVKMAVMRRGVDTEFFKAIPTPPCDDPLLITAAKRVAEARQHGCHYAESACVECVAIAEAVLRVAIPYEHDPSWRISQSAYRSLPVWRVLWAYQENDR